MECGHDACASGAEKLWEPIYEYASGAYLFGQDHIFCLIGFKCVLLLVCLWTFHCCTRFIQGKQRIARHATHRVQSKIERDATIAPFWSEVQSSASRNTVSEHPMSVPVPRKPRSRNKRAGKSQPPVRLMSSGSEISSDSTVVDQVVHVVPMLMSIQCRPSCTSSKSCAEKLKQTASEMGAPGHDVRHFRAASCSFVQTHLKLSTDTANKLTDIAAKNCCDITVQLSRWRAYCVTGDGVKTFKLEEESQVPVILHSSYAAGILTIEGLHLAQSTIQIASMKRCIDLKTKYYEERAGRLDSSEIHTCMCQLPIKNLADMSVLAFKQIDMDGHSLRVSSLAVPIQDDNFRIVIRYMLPFCVLIIFGAKHIFSSMMDFMKSINTTPMVAWSIPALIVIATQVLPQSMETSIRVWLKKLPRQMYYTLSFAIQSFICEEDANFFSANVEYCPRDSSAGVNAEDCPRDSSAGPNRDAVHGEPGIATTDFSRNRRRKTLHRGMSSSESDSDDFAKTQLSNVKKPQRSPNCEPVLSSEWKWPVFDTLYDKRGKPFKKLRADGETKTKDSIPFKVIYLHRKNLPWANQLLVKIYSPFLKKAIREATSGDIDQWAMRKTLKMDGPGLFRIRGKLRERYEILKEAEHKRKQPSSSADVGGNSSDFEELQHHNHLVRFMNEELKEIELMYKTMKDERSVTWSMLWAFFPPEERVVYTDVITEVVLCGTVSRTEYISKEDGTLELVIRVSKWDYNCQTFKKYSPRRSFLPEYTIPAYANEQAIVSLKIRPLQYEEDPKATEKNLLEQGKRFCELSMMERSCFMSYRGVMIRFVEVNDSFQLVKEPADGRVMIDLGSFAKMNPNYPLGSAKPPSEVIRDNDVRCIDISTATDRMFAPSLVYGFSFRLKQWGSFITGGFSMIFFNDSAYEFLVMDAKTKELTEVLVREHLQQARKVKDPGSTSRKLDPIVNKGEGCIFLCYGPPGTGKTLTAESLSEKLHCPLWSLSVSELGLTPSKLEETLMKVMDIGALWGAILLLDEADVFLERRSSSDLTRNAMTGVFLRQLEYYRGVLFLTTNRESAFDEAISSRIAHFLYFERHNEDQRREIWSKLLDHACGNLKVSPEILVEFSKPQINGREIRNIMQTAQTLARSTKRGSLSEEEEEPLVEVQHVRDALRVYIASSKLRTKLTPPSRAGPPEESQADGVSFKSPRLAQEAPENGSHQLQEEAVENGDLR